MDSCRIEKAYRHFGHDVTDEDHILEAGLGFTVDMDKKNFLGKDAISKKLDNGLEKMLLQFSLVDPEPLLYHNEPIIRNGEIVGHLTSGNYGHYLKSAIGLGYVPCKNENINDLIESNYQIEIAGRRCDAKASLKPMYDPKSLKIKN